MNKLSFVFAMLLIVSLRVLWADAGTYGQSTASQSSAQAIALIEEGIQLVKDGEPEAARSRFEHAGQISPDDASVQQALGKGYEALGDNQRALENYFNAALFGVRSQQVYALAALDVRRVMSGVPIPRGYRTFIESRQYNEARNLAPWLPAAYWAMAMQANIEGKRSEATNRFRDFQTVMQITGLDKPFREWTIETDQVRYQIGKIETDFLVEAGFLDSSWQERVHEGDRREVLQIFGAVEPEIWNLSEEAMRYTYRFKTLHVAKLGADFNSIQSAVDALMRAGGAGQIIVEPGTYFESLDLHECGRVVIRSTDTKNPVRTTVVHSPTNSPALSIRGGSGLVIDGLRLEAGSAAEAVAIDGARGVTLKHVEVKGGARAAMRFTDAHDVFVWRGVVSNEGLAVRVERSTDVGFASIRLQSAGSPWTIDVVNSEVSFLRATVASSKGSILARGSNGQECSVDCSKLTVANSHLSGGGAQGVALLGGSVLTMKNSRVTGAFDAGIYGHSSQLDLENDVIEISGQDGVVSRGGSARVVDNLIRAVRLGIDASEGARLVAEHNSILDTDIGIQVNEAVAEITNNELTRASTSAIYLRSPQKPWTVSLNKIYGSGTAIAVELAPAFATAATCESGSSSTIGGNTLTWNQHGIVLANLDNRSGGSVCVEHNTMAHNRSTGIWLLSGGPNTLLSKSVVAFNTIGIMDPEGRVRIDDSAAYQNDKGDAVPSALTTRGQQLQVINPDFRDPDAGDYRSAPLMIRNIGATGQ